VSSPAWVKVERDRLRHLRAAIADLPPLAESPIREIRPILNRITIEPIHIKTMGVSTTLVMPDQGSDIFYSVIGRVVAVGPGVPRCRHCEAGLDSVDRPHIPIYPGDIVIFTGSAYSMNFEGFDYKLATDDEIVGVVDLG